MTPAERVNKSSGSAAHTVPFLMSRQAPSCPAVALAKADAGVADRHRPSVGNAALREAPDLGPREFPLGPEVCPQASPYPVVERSGQRLAQARAEVSAPAPQQAAQFAGDLT